MNSSYFSIISTLLGSPLLCHSLRKTSSSQGGKSELVKQSLKKPKLPEGRFDAPEDSHLEKEPLESKYNKAPLSFWSIKGSVLVIEKMSERKDICYCLNSVVIKHISTMSKITILTIDTCRFLNKKDFQDSDRYLIVFVLFIIPHYSHNKIYKLRPSLIQINDVICIKEGYVICIKDLMWIMRYNKYNHFIYVMYTYYI